MLGIGSNGVYFAGKALAEDDDRHDQDHVRFSLHHMGFSRLQAQLLLGYELLPGHCHGLKSVAVEPGARAASVALHRTRHHPPWATAGSSNCFILYQS